MPHGPSIPMVIEIPNRRSIIKQSRRTNGAHTVVDKDWEVGDRGRDGLTAGTLDRRCIQEVENELSEFMVS